MAEAIFGNIVYLWKLFPIMTIFSVSAGDSLLEYIFAHLGMFPRFRNYSQFRHWYPIVICDE